MFLPERFSTSPKAYLLQKVTHLAGKHTGNIIFQTNYKDYD